MNNPNYHKLLLQNIEKNKERGVSPKLLLHACCAPCLTYCLTFLNPHYDITVYFYNPNIYDESEYYKRLDTLKSFLAQFKQRQNKEVNLIVPPFNPQEFDETALGYEGEKEGGKRCALCFDLRFTGAAQYAAKNGYDLFGTTLTISPRKDSTLINLTGENVSKKEGVGFLFSDFKKEDGFLKSIQLCKEYNLYRQNYCGCYFSYNGKNPLRQGD